MVTVRESFLRDDLKLSPKEPRWGDYSRAQWCLIGVEESMNLERHKVTSPWSLTWDFVTSGNHIYSYHITVVAYNLTFH